MKKNLRIVSAAAAALLAVAPVAATGVSTVFAADTPVSVDGSTTTNTANVAKLSLNVTNAANLVGNDSPSKVAASISTTTLPAGATVVPAKAQIYAVNADNTVAAKPTTDKLVGGQKYVAKVVVSITGLTSLAGKDKGLTVNDKAYDVNGSGIATGIELTSSPFTVPDSTLKGAPYVTYKDNGKDVIADTGSVDLDSNSYTVKGVADKIDASRTTKGTYTAAVSVKGTGAATASFLNLEKDVKDALTAAGVTVKADGSFDKPATPFVVTTHIFATNGKTATFAVRVNPTATVGDPTFPKVTYNGHNYFGTQTIDSVGDARFNYVPLNGVVDTKAIQDAFATTVSDTDTTVMIPTVDVSKVNTKIAGKYPVTVSATNADGKTTKVTFMLTVGDKDATYKTVQSDGDIPVYQIVGNNVTTTKDTVPNGQSLAVFGDPVKIGDKTYVRINNATSDKYVEAKFVDGSYQPAAKETKKIMHNSYIYDKDHKRVGTKTLAAYTTVDVFGKASKLADGSLVYRIGDNQYVMADNIDGTSRTLSHNAYVYKTSKKRANRKVLKAGSQVTTFGSPYTFKNGKAYYRVGGPAKQYVKVANFAK